METIVADFRPGRTPILACNSDFLRRFAIRSLIHCDAQVAASRKMQERLLLRADANEERPEIGL